MAKTYKFGETEFTLKSPSYKLRADVKKIIDVNDNWYLDFDKAKEVLSIILVGDIDVINNENLDSWDALEVCLDFFSPKEGMQTKLNPFFQASTK